MSTSSNGPRIAVVQSGDHRVGVDVLEARAVETYFGMRNSTEVIESFLAGRPHLVVSVNAPAYRIDRPDGTLLGLPRPGGALGRRGLRRLGTRRWIKRLLGEFDAFAPTHALIRTGTHLTEQLMPFLLTRGLGVAVVFAGALTDDGRRTQRLVASLNHHNVSLVANHNIVAAQSLMAYGVDPSKVMAYDWPGYREPSQHPVKGLATGRPLRVLFVGNMHPAKGLGELLLAVGLLRKRGLDVELTAVGDGPALSSFKAKAKRVADGCVTFVGRRSNDDAFALMRDSAVLCVPTRPSFAEGMPFVIREGLASRTPVLVSDHPVFASAFREGEGIRYFVAGDASSLADSLGAVLSDPAAYAALSAATENAFERTRCGMLFSDVIRAWNV